MKIIFPKNNEYQMALSEYQRAYYITDNILEKNALKMNIGQCYYYLHNYDSSIELYESIIGQTEDKILFSESMFF